MAPEAAPWAAGALITRNVHTGSRPGSVARVEVLKLLDAQGRMGAFLAPVVTEPAKAICALKWAVEQMEDRYRKMAKLGVRNIDIPITPQKVWKLLRDHQPAAARGIEAAEVLPWVSTDWSA